MGQQPGKAGLRIARALLLLASFVLPWSCESQRNAATAKSRPAESAPPDREATPQAYPEYLSRVDGLHVTGTPIEVDMESYRLRIGGKVERPVELTYDQVRAMAAEKIGMALDCPGFFTDIGVWTGVRVSSLLRDLGVKSDAKSVRFISVDGGYSSTLALETMMNSVVLVAYEFDGNPFPVYHGFPLRIAAQGMPGSIWVKWLGSITVE